MPPMMPIDNWEEQEARRTFIPAKKRGFAALRNWSKTHKHFNIYGWVGVWSAWRRYRLLYQARWTFIPADKKRGSTTLTNLSQKTNPSIYGWVGVWSVWCRHGTHGKAGVLGSYKTTLCKRPVLLPGAWPTLYVRTNSDCDLKFNEPQVCKVDISGIWIWKR